MSFKIYLYENPVIPRHFTPNNYYLVELQNVKQLEKLLVLFIFLQLDIMLLQAVKGQLGLIIDIHFHRLKNPCVSKIISYHQ